MLRLKWRVYIIVIIFMVMFGGLFVRLMQVQLWEPQAFGPREVDLVTRANQQHSQSFLVDSGRGTIYDRNGVALTGERDYHVVVFPLVRKEQPLYRQELSEIAGLLGWSDEQLLQQLRKVDKPQTLKSVHTAEPVTVTEAQAEQIQALQIPGIHALYSEEDRYATDRLAHHLLGTIGFNPDRIKHDFQEELKTGEYTLTDAVGLRGLEASFEQFLHNSGVNRLTYTVDGAGHPLVGERTEWVNTLRSDSDSAKSLVTTIDARIQQVVEHAVDQPPSPGAAVSSAEGVEDGAAVVLDIATGDVLAMVSRPREGTGEEKLPGWVNRALQPMEPGSIFKTVVAVAALDQGMVQSEDNFYCDGKLEEYNLPCWTFDQGGHGHLTFADAYAHSCNVVFGQLAVQLGEETIADYANKLGLGRKISWQGDVYHDDAFAQLSEEEAGQIFHDERAEQDGYALAQTGIGQRDVRVTPLQVANMVGSLFHPGHLPHPRVVSEILYANGDPYFHFAPSMEPLESPIKTETLQTVRDLMAGVVADGTATSRLSGALWQLGGKTGTAQIAETGKEHKWMIGYGPAESPKYAVAVVVREVSDDSQVHMDVFRAIMDGLARKQTELTDIDQ